MYITNPTADGNVTTLRGGTALLLGFGWSCQKRIQKMECMLITEDYPEFLAWLYGRNPGLCESSFAKQVAERRYTLFGGAEFDILRLRSWGHSASLAYLNNQCLQTAWARDVLGTQHVRRLRETPTGGKVRKAVTKLIPTKAKPKIARLLRARRSKTSLDLLKLQISYHQPDILINHAVNAVPCDFISSIDPKPLVVVGEHAATPLNDRLDCYDIIFSSFPTTITNLTEMRVRAELLPLGFETTVLEEVQGPSSRRDIDVSFVGSLGRYHSSRVQWLEYVCQEIPSTGLWGPPIDHLPKRSPLHDHYRGQAWGRDLYSILLSSKITLNHHGDIPTFANNSRMYESTGCGALLITDRRENLDQIFDVGSEVLAYDSPEETVHLIDRFLSDPIGRRSIAAAGQARTLRTHTHEQRLRRMISTIESLVPQGVRRPVDNDLL